MRTRDKRRLVTLRRFFSKKRRGGFTLVEMALAMAVTASFLAVLTGTVAEGLNMQVEADRLTLALSVAQAKLSQLRNNPTLSATDVEGELDDAGMYSGYGFRLQVKEEKLDLAKIAESGKIESPAVNDQLPASVQNTQGNRESAGSSEQTQTGGLIDTLRIIVTIKYPIGNGRKELRVETLQAARQKVEASGQ